jgi:single-strand DNA-binding protein
VQTQIQLIANLTHDPELRYTTSGKAYARIRLASTPRVKDSSGAWVDGATTFYEGRAWNDLAEHVAESLRRGDRVIVFGALRTERWTDSTGEDREALRVDVDEIGPSLRFANAKVTKTQRSTSPSTASPAGEDTADPADPADPALAAARAAVAHHLGGRATGDAPF